MSSKYSLKNNIKVSERGFNMFEMDCTCSQGKHSVPVKAIEVAEGAINKIPELLSGYKRVFMVADENTYEAAGKDVEKILKDCGIFSHKCILEKDALPTDTNVGKVLIDAGIDEEKYEITHFSTNPDYILAVGSGSVNDICRMVSYRLGIEYGIVGTAPSMDGFASVVAPLIIGNRKIVYTCSIARHIIIDLNIASKAPKELLLAGVGDMIGKYIAILDWELSKRDTGEYFCEKVANMVLDATAKCIVSSQKLFDREPETIRDTVDGLILSGLGIAYTGSSRPASGTEHMVGQTWEIMSLERGEKPNLHGIEVGEATFVAIEMYERLYRETDDAELKALIEKYLPHFDTVKELQKTLRIPFTVTSKKEYIEGILRGRTFRERYTLLEYLHVRGKLLEYAEDSFEPVMKKYNYN